MKTTTPAAGIRSTMPWALLAASLLFCAGCSGINATKSISPLDFLLPGLMQSTPPSLAPPAGTNTLLCGLQGHVPPSRAAFLEMDDSITHH